MVEPSLSLQAFVKTVGYGVAIAELIRRPDERILDEAASLASVIAESGWNVLEMLGDPEKPSAAIMVLPEGLPQSRWEKNQTTEEDWERLRRVARYSGSPILARRLALLEKGTCPES